MIYTNIIYITLNYKRTSRIKIAYTNYFTSSLNIYTGKILVFNFSTLFNRLSINKKPYYNSSLFLNKSIDLTNIDL